MFRKVLFWSHLVCGVVSSLVILMMSVTGVLLTYERQILAWAEKTDYVPASQQQERISLEQLHFVARTEHNVITPSTIVVTNDPGAPVAFTSDRRGGVNLNPYTGEAMEVGSPELEGFFSTTTGIHRWFNLTGESRNLARSITGASNLMFLFIVLSGVYLWFPKMASWAMFKIRLAFRDNAGDSKARDFNWHHVIGIWSAIPLAVIVATASVFYYPWANNLVYQVHGEQPPIRGSAPVLGEMSVQASVGSVPATEPVYLSLDDLLEHAQAFITRNGDTWRQVSIGIPSENQSTVNFAIDQGNGGQPHLRHNLKLARETGAVVDWQPFSSQSPGRRTRSIIRFLHTGEAMGIIGQTIAGLVSFTSLLMVWTGLALAWRRLVTPLLLK